MKKYSLIAFTLFLSLILKAQNYGTVGSFAKISATSGNFTGPLNSNDRFGRNLVNIGDLNGDGIEDLAVGANYDDDGGTNKGAVWILFLNSNGTVNSQQKISIGNGGFTGFPDLVFGTSVGLIGDLNGDGIQDIVVGETDSNDGAFQAGAVWILFLNTNGTVSSHQKISSTTGNLNTNLTTNGRFGSDVAGIGDIDNDGLPDIAVSQQFGNSGGSQKGAVWILRLNANGTVKAKQEISATTGGFTGSLDIGDNFGSSVANLGDFDNDGINDILVGARRDDDGGTDRGAVWIIYLNANGTVKANQKISSTQGNFTGTLGFNDRFGISSEALGDIDGDNITDIAIGAYLDDDGGTDRGAVWILFMNANGTVKGHQKISNTQGGFNGQLDNEDHFGGWGISVLNDLNNDGIKDLAVCAVLDDDGGGSTGAVWILFLNCNSAIPSNLSVNLGTDTTLCNNSTLQLNATNNQATNYLWQDGSTNPIFNVMQTGNYIVTISDACYTATDTINVRYYNSQITADLGVDTVLCNGESLTLNVANSTAISYLWQDGSTNSTFNVTQSGIYFVQIQDSCNIVSDTINVLYNNSALNINLGTDTTLCNNNTLQLNAMNSQATNYLWQDGSTNPIFNVMQTGNYIVTISDACYSATDTINVRYYNSQITADLGVDTVLCNGESLTLNVTNPTAINYLWQDGSTNSTFTITAAGTYYVQIEDSCNIVSDTINVLYNNSTLNIDLGTDTTLCNNNTLQLNATNSQATNYLWQDGSTNPTFNVMQTGNYIVTISDACYTATDTINVRYYNSQITADLGADTVLCNGESLTLNIANSTAISYLWQDGSTNSTFNVTQSGIYFVQIQDSCNIVSDTINVLFTGNSPTLNLEDNIESCIGETVIIDATTTDANIYLWNGGTTNPIIEISSEGQYTVEATNNCGTSMDSIYVNFIDCNCYIAIPNAFSPQSSQNTTFYPITEGVCNFTNYRFLIFNRWGNQVFETNDINTQWDGIYKNELQPQDTYTWIIDYELGSGAKEILKGSVLLVR